MSIKTINPATGSILHEYPMFNQDQVHAIIQDAHNCFQSWRVTSFVERATLMCNLAALLRERKLEYANLMAQEMGKPISMGVLEIEKSALVCEYYAQHAANELTARSMQLERAKSWVCYEPLGIILAIMPWNFPFWQVFRFAAPNIIAGNVGLLKHAAIATGTGSAIAKLFVDAGFPAGVLQQLVIPDSMAADVIADVRVTGVTLTGSERAGRSVASIAGQYLKKVVLELGGSDPCVVLSDADLDAAAHAIVVSRLSNTGQVCIAAKRIIAVAEVMPQLLDRIKLLMQTYKIGDPLASTTQLGPMAREDLRQTVHRQVQDSVDMGAQLHCGGILPSGAGFYYPPTLLTQVIPGMPAFDDEVFGPVVAMITAKHTEEAISLANQTRFGLGASIFTKNLDHGRELAMHALDAGACFVNSMVVSDPRLPFGGIKNSGFGRELAREGLIAFMNIKTVVLHD